MPSFSERKGFKPVRAVVQKDAMDAALRNGLWNGFQMIYWSNFKGDPYGLHNYPGLNTLMHRLWHDYFKVPIDTLPYSGHDVLSKVREYYFKCQWNEVYDFIEFIANKYSSDQTNQRFMDFCNKIMEREMSAYRFVSGQITEITSDQEIEAIEAAIKQSSNAVNEHLKRSLELLSDRKSPDYRNSIKESISAVEAMCRLIVGQPKATLGQAIGKVKGKVAIHPALEKAFDSLYGFTSDEHGIRHSLLEESTLDFEDSKFMLVSCANFINYLLAKSAKAGMKL